MRKILIGKSEVPWIGLGTAGFGGGISADDSFGLMDAFVEAGGMVIDTARVYGEWIPDGGGNVSEKTIGKWLLKNKAANVFLSTKGAHYSLNTRDLPRVNPSAIKQDIEESLATLGRRIDLYFLHRDDPTVPVDEIMDALHEQVEAGNTAYLGASNWRPERIAKANEYAAKTGKSPFTVSQVLLSYARPNPYEDPTIMPYEPQDESFYINSSMTVMGFTSQAQGYFTKALNGTVSGSTKSNFDNEYNKNRIERVKLLAEKHSVTPEAIILAYFEHIPFKAMPIIGCRSLEQLRQSLEADKISLSKDDVDMLINV